jgi:hypothetical protein
MNESAVQNAANEKQVQRMARREKSSKEIRLDDLRIVMGTPAGRRFVWRLLGEFCHVNEMSFSPANSTVTAFAEGERNVGNRLVSEIHELDMEFYLLMQKEAMEKANAS